MRVTKWTLVGNAAEVRRAMRLIPGDRPGWGRGSGRLVSPRPANELIDTVGQALARDPLPPGQRKVIRALYHAGEEGLTLQALATANARDEMALRRVLRRMARRINRTPGVDNLNRPGIGLFFDVTVASDEWHYRMRPELRSVLDDRQPGWLTRSG